MRNGNGFGRHTISQNLILAEIAKVGNWLLIFVHRHHGNDDSLFDIHANEWVEVLGAKRTFAAVAEVFNHGVLVVV